MECKNCGDEMKMYDSPKLKILFKIPFTERYISIMDYGAKEPLCFCGNDIREEENFRSAAQVGYEKAQEDYECGRWG